MSGIGRASVLIGAGTIVSRLSGFLRAVVLVSAVGATTEAGNAFAIANQLPNNIYAIISTGLLSAVVVPQIVKAAAHDDGGRAFVSKLFTLGTVVLLVTAVLATIAAPWLVQLLRARVPARAAGARDRVRLLVPAADPLLRPLRARRRVAQRAARASVRSRGRRS